MQLFDGTGWLQKRNIIVLRMKLNEDFRNVSIMRILQLPNITWPDDTNV